MNEADIINLAFEQTVEKLGDPTPAIFELMYERFPELQQYKDEDSDWEKYMMEEILMNFMQFGEDPDTALVTIRDMSAHHQLIGVPNEVFKGLYQAMFDALSPAFSGPHREEMVSVWKNNIEKINHCIESVA